MGAEPDGVSAGVIRAYLIADIRGYTSFTVEHGDEAAAELAAAFAEVMERVAATGDGQLVELRGDEALLCFNSSRQALRAALGAQEAFAERSRARPEAPLRVGIGLDAGEAVAVRGGYRGKALNLAARLCSLAGPGEVLVSEAVTHLAGHLEELAYQERGLVQLKGFSELVPVVEVRLAAPRQTIEREVAPEKELRLPIGAYLGALPSTPLIGREEEIAKGRRVLDQVTGGEGRTLLLAGEPGAGKTRLAQELFLQARNSDFLLGVGSCLETRQGVPYYPFLDVLPALMRQATPVLGFEPAQRWPQLRTLDGASAGDDRLHSGTGGQAEEERLRREVTAFISEVARLRKVAIFVDDLHWADDSAILLFHHLAQHTRATGVLLVGTYRDVEVGRQHPLEKTLRELRRSELSVDVSVRRLAIEGTAALMAASFDEEAISEEFAELVHHQTEGNPFFIQQVLRALVERGDVYREKGRWDRRKVAEIEIPESIRSTIGERVSRLPEATQEVVGTASILGHGFRFADLVHLTELGEDGLDAALEPAAASGLVRTSDGERYLFDHALTQQTLRAEIPHRKRRRLHAAAGRVLAGTPDAEARAAEIALQFVEGDEALEAARWSVIAARSANRLFAHREAEKHFRAAAELAAEAAQVDLQAEALTGLGESLRALGRLAGAAEALEEATGHFRARNNPDREGEAVALLGRVRREMLDPASAITALETFVGRNTDIGDGPLAGVLAELARNYWMAGRHSEMAEPAERAARLATASGNTAARLSADLVRAHVLDREGRLEAERDLLTAAVADSAAWGELTDQVALNNNLAFTHWNLGDSRQNEIYRGRALELAEQFAYRDSLCFGVTMHAQALRCLGDLDRAEAGLRRAEALLEDLSTGRAGSYFRGELVELKVARGLLAEAEPLLQSLDGSISDGSDIQLQSWIATLWCQVLVRTGRPAEATARVERQLEINLRQDFRPAWMLSYLSWALAKAGRAEEAAEHAADAVARSRREHNISVLIDALRFQGIALSGLGRWNEADAAFEEAEALARKAPYPFGLAWTQLEWSRSMANRGDEVRAAEMAREGMAGFSSIGAEPLGFEVPDPLT